MSSDFKEEQYDKAATVRFNPASGFEFNDLDGMFRAAQCYLQSGFAPPAFRTPQQLIICWARGAELGLKPLQAIDGMTVINNRIGIMGDLALAMVRQTGELAKYEKEWVGEGDNLTCKVRLQRKGRELHEYTFSVAEAKHAQIYERSPTWKGYPKRMTYYRALGFGLRDEFSDVLKGLYTSEELEDLAHFEQVAAAKENVQYVDAETGQRTNGPAAAPSPSAPPLEAQLTREHPKAAQEAAQAQRKETLMGPSADFAEAQARQQAPQEQMPDDIDMGDKQAGDNVVPMEQQKPWWVDHEIKGVRSFAGRTVGSLSPQELALIESKWIPAAHQQMAKATDDQLKDLKAFEERIEHDKTAKPW
jgi:hypothetical protein